MLKKGVKEKLNYLPVIILLFLFLISFSLIREFIFKPTIIGFVTLTYDTYCDQTKVTGYYDIGGQIDCSLNSNGAIFNAANTELNCQDNTITGGGSAGFGMNITSVNSNVNIRNCKITSFTTEGIHLFAANNTLIWNSNISTNTNFDIKLTRSINVTLLNVNYSKINISGASNYTVQWYIRAKVNYTNGTNVNSATVIAFNSTQATYTLTTNSSGHAIFNATEFTNHTGTTAYYATYSVNATIGNFRASNSSVLIGSGNKDVILTLTEDSPPNVSNLTYPLNASSITSAPIDFNFTAEDDYNIVNCTLYANFSGSWLANNSRDINYNYSNKTFNITIPSLRDGTYIWNMQCTDNSTIVQTDFYDNNFTFTINTCGGGLCSGTELCSSCSSDCGTCSTSDTGSSSGGGSSGGSSSGCSSTCNTLNEKKCTFDNEAWDICLQNPDGCRYWSNRVYCEPYQICKDGQCVCKNECSYAYKKCVDDKLEECIYERGCFKRYTREDEKCKQEFLALTQGDCYNHCNNSKQDCFETGIDCGDGCKKCPVEEQPIQIPIPLNKILIPIAVIITTGILFSLWPLLLSSLIPFMFLRFRHYYVYLIDLSSLINNEHNLIKTLEHSLREPITYVNQEEKDHNIYIFKKDGFIDVINHKPLTIIAHFIYKKRAKKFARSLKKTLKHILPETKEKQVLIHSIKVGREHPSIAYKLRHRK